MRQAFRRYAFPLMIIAAVLAAALPLNSFALDYSVVALNTDLLYNFFASDSWNYLSTSSAPYFLDTILYTDGFLIDNNGLGSITSNNQFPLFLRQAPFSPIKLGRPFSGEFKIPIFSSDLLSLNFNFYFGVSNEDGSLLDSFSLDNVVLYLNNSPAIEIPFTQIDSLFEVSVNPLIPDIPPTEVPSSVSVNGYTLNYSSSSFFDLNYIGFQFSFVPSSEFYLISFGLSPTSTLTTVSSNVASLIRSISILAQLLDTVISQQESSNAQIIDYLDQILAAVEAGGSGGSGSDPGTGEGEEILQEGAIKQEQLEQLGDALSNVPKPSIENITQSFDPADTLISADPGMIQNALSIVYSWDKFLILLGLFIAVGTISYIIFGKKS